VPSKLKRHLELKHPFLKEKKLGFHQTWQKTKNCVKASDIIQEASCVLLGLIEVGKTDSWDAGLIVFVKNSR